MQLQTRPELYAERDVPVLTTHNLRPLHHVSPQHFMSCLPMQTRDNGLAVQGPYPASLSDLLKVTESAMKRQAILQQLTLKVHPIMEKAMVDAVLVHRYTQCNARNRKRASVVRCCPVLPGVQPRQLSMPMGSAWLAGNCLGQLQPAERSAEPPVRGCRPLASYQRSLSVFVGHARLTHP